jgi:hypothetical protein
VVVTEDVPLREADDPTGRDDPAGADDPAGRQSAESDTTQDVTADESLAGGVPVIAPDEVIGSAQSDGDAVERLTESVNEPAKVLRIGSMVKTLLDEVRAAPLDEKSRVRLREIYEQSIQDLSEGLSPDLVAELKRMTPPFDVAAPSDAELRIAQAQLVGWLEGLFHGIQATLMSQQMAARAQLEEMRQRGLPSAGETGRTGAYL